MSEQPLLEYDLGILTKDEVFAQLIQMLSPESLITIRDAVSSRGWVADFDSCVRGAAQGLPWMMSYGVEVYPSGENINAARLWLDNKSDVSF